MPTIAVNGARLHYEDTGSGAETVVFAHGLLWSGEMFEAQVAALKDRYRCVTFDFRGQGRSEVTRDGYDLDTLTADAAALIETLGLAPCHFVGLSMGGFVGLRLAARRPELLRSLALLETSGEPEPEAKARKYRLLARLSRVVGLRPLAGRVLPIMFGNSFLTDPARAAERDRWRRRLVANDAVGIYRAVMGVVGRPGIADELSAIQVPTLVVVGEEDVATPPEEAEKLAAGIGPSRLVTLPSAGHTSTVEAPETVTAVLEAFLAEHRG